MRGSIEYEDVHLTDVIALGSRITGRSDVLDGYSNLVLILSETGYIWKCRPQI